MFHCFTPVICPETEWTKLRDLEIIQIYLEKYTVCTYYQLLLQPLFFFFVFGVFSGVSVFS